MTRGYRVSLAFSRIPPDAIKSTDEVEGDIPTRTSRKQNIKLCCFDDIANLCTCFLLRSILQGTCGCPDMR